MKFKLNKISFIIPIFNAVIGIFSSLLIIGWIFIHNFERHEINGEHFRNRNVTYNIAINYLGSSLREVELALTRTSSFYANSDKVYNAINGSNKEQQDLMHIIMLFPMISSITLADNNNNYLRVPIIKDYGKLDLSTSPWLAKKNDNNTLNQYTNSYKDILTKEPTIAVYRNLVSNEGNVKGVLAFKLDLLYISSFLRQVRLPSEGEVFVLDSDGVVLLSANPKKNLHTKINSDLIDMITNSGGFFLNKSDDSWYYTYNLSIPNWTVVFKVKNAVIKEGYRSGVNFFLLGSLVILTITILFGFYLRNAYRKMLINILSSIQSDGKGNYSDIEDLLDNAIKENKHRERELMRENITDALTKCKNRRAFDIDIANYTSKNIPFCLAIVDIDNFKSINDKYGHLIGDLVLKNVAKDGLTLFNDDSAILYRYGGEEFAVIFITDDVKYAFKLLDKWRDNIQKRDWRENGLKVTFSGGIERRESESVDEIISKTDSLLYLAKKRGKNLIESASVKNRND